MLPSAGSASIPREETGGGSSYLTNAVYGQLVVALQLLFERNREPSAVDDVTVVDADDIDTTAGTGGRMTLDPLDRHQVFRITKRTAWPGSVTW